MKSKYLILTLIILISVLFVAFLSSQITSSRIESDKFSITAIGLDNQNQAIEQPLQVISEQIEKKDAKNCIILRFPDGLPMNITYLLIVAEQLPVPLRPALKKEPWALFSLNQIVEGIPINARLLLLFNSELDIRSPMKKYGVVHGLIRLQLLRFKFRDYSGNPVEDLSALVAPGLTLVRLDLKNRPPSPEQEKTCSFHRHSIKILSRQIKGTIYVEAPPAWEL